jgi:hypothetical protein
MTKRKKWLAMTSLSVIARAQPEAISSLHIPVGVRCSEEIASLTTFARNDEKGVFARNDEKGVFARNDGVGLQARNDAMGLRRLQWRNKNIVNCLSKVLIIYKNFLIYCNF